MGMLCRPVRVKEVAAQSVEKNSRLLGKGAV
jgi:hypothetical protein